MVTEYVAYSLLNFSLHIVGNTVNKWIKQKENGYGTYSRWSTIYG